MNPHKQHGGRRRFLSTIAKDSAFLAGIVAGFPLKLSAQRTSSGRIRRLIDEDWRFTKADPAGNAVSLPYDLRPQPGTRGAPATTSPEVPVVKEWILPSGIVF